MTSLPDITQVSATARDEIVVDFEVRDGSAAFAGHFPGNPILPGVIQIDWAIHFAKEYLKIEPSGRDLQVKFRDIIRPGIPITLTLRHDREKQRLSFSYTSISGLMSHGHLKLKAS